MDNKYRKRRSDSDYSDSKRRRDSEKCKISDLGQFIDLRSELRDFIQEHFNFRQTNDFWQFFEKYVRANKAKEPPQDIKREKLLYFNYVDSVKSLYEKLPAFDRYSRKIQVDYEIFKDFVHASKVYEDFLQRSKFSKLKKLRESAKELPIAQHKNELIEALKTKRVVLIAGDTGCGKSTQVPQYVLEAGYEKIVCTQPRRLACISLAKRVAYESLNSFTDVIGYQIRFEKSRRAGTKVVFMTEGLLLRQTSNEDVIKSYDVIILDEVHERNLQGDFLIGLMKCLLQTYKNFKLILMSATINLELFKSYFQDEDLHVIEVPGRLFPIEIKYFPIIKDPYERKNERFDSAPYLRIIEMIDQKYDPKERGDLLIFLNGYSEISTLAENVNEYAQRSKNWIVLILHSSVSIEEQDKIFDYPPEGVRKCIISTNIAETSITIDGIRFVVDSGKVNRMTYENTGGINKLKEVLISKDSAKQRSGRAGRTGPGICFRMYSEQDYENFDTYTPAEIHLVPLESLLLQMISLGLRNISNFPFLEKPNEGSIEKSLEKLKFCGALALEDDCLILTPLGQFLSNLPVDLTIGKMLVTSTIFGNVDSVLILAALLSVQSPLTIQASRNVTATNLLKPLESSHGDAISLLNYYREWMEIKRDTKVQSRKGPNKQESSKAWCKKRCLEEARFYEVTKLYTQFRDILVDAELIPKIDIELTKNERQIRIGELKTLKSMRYELKMENFAPKRKQLEISQQDSEGCVEKTDIKDVEFRILNDPKFLDKLLKEIDVTSYTTLTLLKLILSCGLYPQLAVEDEFNSAKTVSEKLFHTKNKNYIFLRPYSYFALNYEILELHNDEIEVPPAGYFNKRPLSKKHQILVYQSILETKKVYLVNNTRMPLLQTLLLYSRTITTNTTLTKFVFDDFLQVHVPYFPEGKSILIRALNIRSNWNKILESKLLKHSEINQNEISQLRQSLLQFIKTEVVYNFKRLLPADLKIIYNSNSEFFGIPSKEAIGFNPFDPGYSIKENSEYGGLQVSQNVIYNCLVQEEWEYDILERVLSEPFECSLCNESKHLSEFLDILVHEGQCRSSISSSESKVETIPTSSGHKPNARHFKCDKCQKEFCMTPVEILKHKKSCL